MCFLIAFGFVVVYLIYCIYIIVIDFLYSCCCMLSTYSMLMAISMGMLFVCIMCDCVYFDDFFL